MKKGLLITLIACGVLFLAGIAAFVIGLALGGSPSFAYDIREKKLYSNKKAETYSDDLDVDAFDALNLEVDAGDLTIQEGDSFHVSYKLYRKPVITVKDGVLTIKPEKEKLEFTLFQFGTITEKSYLTITVPEGTDLKDNIIDLDAGDFIISGIDMDSLNLDVDAGEVKLSDMKIDTLKADIDAGDADITTCEFGSIKIDVDAGNVDIDDSKLDKITADVDFGNIDMDLHGEEADYGINIDCDAGNVSVNGKKTGNNYSCEGKGGKNISVNVDAGNVSIEFK
ncbi:MAG: DUF4097 family beta strand repeat protein [Eubacterium sp.]|nr:DUF4097 family beta strand repeat protein [Eubacterium sp.]